MVIMLGTNDTKTHFHVNAKEIGYGMEELIIKAQHILRIRGSKAKILLVAPVPICPEDDPMFGPESAEKSEELGGVYRELARTWDCLYLDAKTVTREVGGDKIHLTANAHSALGRAIAAIIKENE